MPDPRQPLRSLLALFAGWIHREQAHPIDHLVEENRVLRKRLGDKRHAPHGRPRPPTRNQGQGARPQLLAKVATIVHGYVRRLETTSPPGLWPRGEFEPDVVRTGSGGRIRTFDLRVMRRRNARVQNAVLTGDYM